MGKAKIWLIVAISLTFLGCVLFGGAMTMLNWDFSKLSTSKLETNHHTITGDFRNITINTETADILFVPSEDGTCKVVCNEQKKLKHTVAVENGALTITAVDERAWYEHIGISFKTPKITVYLPDAAYGALCIRESTGDIEIPKAFTFDSMDISISTGDVTNSAAAKSMKIKTTTGDIRVENTTADSLALSATTGEVIAKSITCARFTSDGSTGDVTLENVIATEKMAITRSTGDVHFDSCDGGEMIVKTSTGDVSGSLLTDKVFITQTSTGDVDVPKTTFGGRCEISTSTGDIEIHIP